MAENSTIEWTDHTFNPWEGCQKVGPGCDHCYAETRNARFGGGVAVNWGPGAPRRRTSVANWAQPLKWNAQAAREGRRFRVFCASLADVFDNQVPPVWRADLYKLIGDTPHLDWLLLTKRIGNVGNMIPFGWQDFGMPANVWLGATVVDQAEAERDIPKLLDVPARVRFLSIEPMLGRIYIEDIPDPAGGECLKPLAGLRWIRGRSGRCETHRLGARIDWVICGGESGSKARPMRAEWAQSLRDQCAAAGVPFLFKQWGEYLGEHQDGAHDHEPLELNASDDPVRVGKKAAGRLLDGRTHDEFPITSQDPTK